MKTNLPFLNTRHLSLAIIALSLFLSQGCSMSNKQDSQDKDMMAGIETIEVFGQTIYYNEQVNNITDFRRGMDRLFSHLRHNLRSEKISDRTIAITDFVNTEDIDNVSKFGRYCGSEAYNVLPGLDFNVVEIKAGKSLYIQKGKGEILLTRESEKLRERYHFSTMLVGTYTITNESVQVNARIVRMKDLWVLSSASLVVSRIDNEFLKSFFNDEKSMPPEVKKRKYEVKLEN